MGRARPDLIRVLWENPPDPNQVIHLIRRVGVREYERRVATNDYVTQIEAAAILGTSVMTVNRHVRARRIKDVRRSGISMIRLGELLRFRREWKWKR